MRNSKEVKWADKEEDVRRVSKKLRSGIKHQKSSMKSKSSLKVQKSGFDCNVLADVFEGQQKDYVP